MEEGKPSYTAYVVAKSIAESAKIVPSLVTAEQVRLATIFRDHYELQNEKAARIGKFLKGRRLKFFLDNFIISGLFIHYAARKNFIRNAVLQSGVKQVVVIGAGYDSLALELAKDNSDIQFYEIDFPATQSSKLSALKDSGEILPNNIHFFSGDLMHMNVDYALTHDGLEFDVSAPSIFVIEGVLMYLGRQDVEKLISDIARASCHGSKIVFGVMGRLDSQNKGRKKITNYLLGEKKEKFASSFNEEEVGELMNRFSYEIEDVRYYDQLQQGVVRNTKKLQKERGEHYYLAVKTGS